MGSSKKEWVIAGLMSGTSLDGLDIAICKFKKTNTQWNYEILDATTISYSKKIKATLKELINSSAFELAKMEAQFGKFSGEQVKKFIHNKPYSVDLIASHGHTIFHQPSNGFTTQIGSGAHILAASNIPVVTDFRSLDVGLGGQGAPLVPIGDKLLFNTYPYCLNLGGIANISFDKKNKRIAGDICSVNILLNKLAEEKGKLFDRNGLFASKGIIDQPLLKSLNAHAFYKKEFPKSIGREWIDRMIFPILNKANISTEDKLATCCEHIAIQIASMVKQAAIPGELLITGGGAYNQFLVQRIKFHTPKTNSFVFPNKEIISFKEALIFAFLGLKRILGEENALSSVTGASQNSIGGALYGAIKGAN